MDAGKLVHCPQKSRPLPGKTEMQLVFQRQLKRAETMFPPSRSHKSPVQMLLIFPNYYVWKIPASFGTASVRF